MESVLIAKFGAEGGGCTVYGQPTAGGWMYWFDGSTMQFDENDEEIWIAWSCEPVSRLTEALPHSWWLMLTTYVHPDYETQLHREFMKHRNNPRWQEFRFYRYRNM